MFESVNTQQRGKDGPLVSISIAKCCKSGEFTAPLRNLPTLVATYTSESLSAVAFLEGIFLNLYN